MAHHNLSSEACKQLEPAYVEKELAKIVADTLQVPGACLEKSFIELGGDSLKAVRIVARVRERLGVTLSLLDVFVLPTFRDLAKRIIEVAGPTSSDRR